LEYLPVVRVGSPKWLIEMGCDWPVVILCGFSARNGYTELGFGMRKDGKLLIARYFNPTMFYAVVQFVNTQFY